MEVSLNLKRLLCRLRASASLPKFPTTLWCTCPTGTVQGGRRRGRQRKRREDSIKEWTGLEWNNLLRRAENREEWRKLVVKSTVVPQRSARLRDRQDKKKIVKVQREGAGVAVVLWLLYYGFYVLAGVQSLLLSQFALKLKQIFLKY